MPSLIMDVPMKRGGTMPMRVEYYVECSEPGDPYHIGSRKVSWPVVERVSFVRDTRDRSVLVDTTKLEKVLSHCD
jgi:hypothetical protein